jgi:hypothetical protein
MGALMAGEPEAGGILADTARQLVGSLWPGKDGAP